MADNLDVATRLLNDALDRYNMICTRLRAQYVPGTGLLIDNTPEVTDRVVQELSRVTSYETEIQYSKACLNQLHNISESSTSVSLNTLPPEILTHIFEDVINIRPCPALEYRLYTPSKSTFLQDPIILSHVCSHWRRIAVNTVALWSHIDIDPLQVHNPRAVARLEAYMARSAGSLLDVHISERSKLSYPFSTIFLKIEPAITDLLTLAAPRMRNLTLSVSRDNKRVYHSYLATCFSHCTPGTLAGVSLRPAGVDSDHLGPLLVTAINLQPDMDKLTGLLSETVETVWHSVKVLQLKAYRPKWTSKAYQGLIELRLVEVGSISQSRLRSILGSNPLLRVLELDLELKDYTPGDTSITAVCLDSLEILVLGGSKQRQLGSILQLIAPGSNPLSLSIVNPYIGSSEFTSKQELARFAARSNITQVCAHEFKNHAQLVELLSLIPTAQVLAIDALQSGAINEDGSPFDSPIEVFYVLNSCSRLSRCTWPQIEKLVEKHHVQKLVLWRYDFRYCGLSEPGRETIPENLLTICPVVDVVPNTDPNPIMEWFGD